MLIISTLGNAMVLVMSKSLKVSLTLDIMDFKFEAFTITDWDLRVQFKTILNRWIGNLTEKVYSENISSKLLWVNA